LQTEAHTVESPGRTTERKSKVVKLGHGRKVTMLWPRECAERAALQAEVSNSLAESHASQDELKITPKNDPSYEEKVSDAKRAKVRFQAREEAYTQHCRIHHCSWDSSARHSKGCRMLHHFHAIASRWPRL